MKVYLDSFDKVKAFVDKVSKFDADVFLESNHRIVDAKSILGIFGLDLLSPLNLIIKNGDAKVVLESVREFAASVAV